MTSFAFILGVCPLVIADGAGAASRRALGTAVFGGMIASTVLAVFFVPVFFVVFQWLSEWRLRPAPVAAEAESAEPRALVGATSDGNGTTALSWAISVLRLPSPAGRGCPKGG